jgi:hypothetical protein
LVLTLGLLVAACGDDNGGPPRTQAPPKVIDSPDDVAVPPSARAVATTLARVEMALRTDGVSAADLRVLGWEQQNAYRALSAHPDWVPTVVGRVPPDVAAIVTANHDAGTGLAGLAEPQPELPDWRIEAPPPLDELVGYYREAEAASGIPWQYLATIHFVETRLGRIRGTSTAGAQGPMQFIPETWARYGEGDINSHRDSILAAGRYLDAAGGPEDMNRALYAYNNSQRYVAAVQGYAGLIQSDERAFRGYYQWQVYYSTVDGVALLPEGYPEEEAVITTRSGAATMES